MKFFGKDLEQDRLFLELRAKYYLATWIASDIDSFINSDQIEVFAATQRRAKDQVLLAIDIINDADNKKQMAQGKHKKCLDIISQHAHVLIELLNFEKSLQNEDDDFISSFTDIAQENLNFYQSYKVFSDESSYENNVALATRQFEAGFIETYQLISSIKEDFVTNKIIKHASALKDIFLNAEEIMNATLDGKKSYEAFKFEFEILASKLCGSRSNQELKEYYCKELIHSLAGYMKNFRELCSIAKSFHLHLVDDIEFLATEEFSFVFNQMEQYQAKITKYAIENNLTELELLEVKMPHIEIYSRRLIKDPIYELTGRSYV